MRGTFYQSHTMQKRLCTPMNLYDIFSWLSTDASPNKSIYCHIINYHQHYQSELINTNNLQSNKHRYLYLVKIKIFNV